MWKELFPHFQELGVTDRVDVGVRDIHFSEILFTDCDLVDGIQMNLILGVGNMISKHIEVVMHPHKTVDTLWGVFGNCHLPLPQIQRRIQIMPNVTNK
jgi:hypothetical protein